MKKIILLLITFYRKFISPLKPPSCRFSPTCSAYTYEAVSRFGSLKGLYLGFRRILRCHPFNPGGNDPVPEKFEFFIKNNTQKNKGSAKN
ncbi:putative membrane protein insertion efficiency factor [Tepiditoga spiralis]|uniref:Putative membrane protein insertion efficiency factor n=1 Tax=Tepiditoga spiralis TaxID=2108365 RepID=A0A7G1G492_9BACT|nr:membrane protein insertion efficiency factor YidD [Tepiditoga spiralis]BBE30036.1 putative membrane protein insertion efficiency factor [Tepiditoga spiralis]